MTSAKTCQLSFIIWISVFVKETFLICRLSSLQTVVGLVWQNYCSNTQKVTQTWKHAGHWTVVFSFQHKKFLNLLSETTSPLWIHCCASFLPVILHLLVDFVFISTDTQACTIVLVCKKCITKSIFLLDLFSLTFWFAFSAFFVCYYWISVHHRDFIRQTKSL